MSQENAIKQLLERLIAIYVERDWEKFHSPKNLTMVIAGEVGELIEPFRFLTEEESYKLDAKTLGEVSDEIADVYLLLVYLANKLGIDPIEASHKKLDKIEKKYPAHLARGSAVKYTAYENLES